MTTFGKILVFVNLVFSLLVCALVIMVFIARTNWKDAYDKKDEQWKAARASADASADTMKSTIDLNEAQLRAAQADKDRAVKELATAQQNLKDLRADNDKLIAKNTELTALADKRKVEVERRAEEVKKQEEFLARATETNTNLIKEMNKYREQAVAATIENRSLRNANQNLVAKLEEAQKDLIRVKTAGTTVAGAKPKINPPLENVEGLIKQADTSGLVTITIGSDSGVLKGHTLEVFRLDPVPSKSMYLGTIRILEVRPNEAVGQPVDRPRAPIQVGDRVASRIG
jgi:hypothetical protein